MSAPEDTKGEEEPSEEELAAFGLALHYIHVMEGPRWRASFSEGIAEDLLDEQEQLDFTAYMMEKLSLIHI